MGRYQQRIATILEEIAGDIANLKELRNDDFQFESTYNKLTAELEMLMYVTQGIDDELYTDAYGMNQELHKINDEYFELA